MNLITPTAEQCEQVRLWRNAPDVLPTLRTREPLTTEQQATFYRNVVCNHESDHRYYALMHDGVFVGFGGLTYIGSHADQDGQTSGEISLILAPEHRREGLGTPAVEALREEGHRLGLTWIVGECYDVNPAQAFWVKTVARCEGTVVYKADRILFRMKVKRV